MNIPQQLPNNYIKKGRLCSRSAVWAERSEAHPAAAALSPDSIERIGSGLASVLSSEAKRRAKRAE